jgi:N-acetylglucosamine repressor
VKTAPVLPEKATHQQTRTFNQQLVLRAAYDHSPTSRADIARLTGLTRTSVSDLVGQLIDDGLVEETGRGSSTGGKAPIMLSFVPDGRHVIGLDLGEGTFSGALVNLRGEVLRSLRRPLDDRDGEDALELVHELVDALRADSQRPLLGVGIGAPGLIDTSTGTVRWAAHLDWSRLRLGPLVETRHQLPVVVANDSQSAALAELTFFRRPRPQNLIVVRVGRGIGAGIIVNRQLFQGDGFGAGEIGHVACGGERRCGCGNIGCLETVASVDSMIRLAAEADPSISDADRLASAFRADSEPATSIAAAGGRELGRAIGGLIGALNIQHVLIVGEAAYLGRKWLEIVQQSARESALPMLARDTTIDFGHPQNDVELGASALLMNAQLGLSLAR